MASLLNIQAKSSIAQSFIDSLSSDNYYMTLGKTTAWPNESIPGNITNSMNDTLSVLNSIFAMKKIGSSNSCLVIPRVNWTSGTVYAQYSPSDSSLYSKNFYVLTTDMNVYKCLSNADGSSSTSRPTGQSTSQIITADGYTWKFLYNLSSSVQVDFLNSVYLPVPSGDKRTSQQILVENTAAYTTGSPAGGHGRNAAWELGATKIIVSQKFEGSESDIIDASVSYREVGLIRDVKLLSGVDANGSVYSVNDTNSTIDIHTGQLVYVETITPVQRNSDQTETVKIIIDFNL